MTKNELMELSRECGLEFCEEECSKSVFVSLAQFANAILERAAVECDERAKWMRTGCTQEIEAMNCATSIRSLKLPIN